MSKFHAFSCHLGVASLFLAIAAPACAADPQPIQITLDDLIVTATRIPTPQDQVASSVTVITAADIARRQLRTLPDVLNSVPGLNVVQSGGPGANTSIFMRGTNSNHVKVLIDGIDVSDPSTPSGAFDFSQILASDISRVEVLRGPQGALYGSDAIGGVISITTLRHKGETTQAALSAEAGSFATFNQTASIGGGVERFDYDLSYTHVHSGATDVTPPALVVPGRTTKPESIDNQTVATRLGAQLTENVDAGVVVRYVHSDLLSTADDTIGPESLRTTSDNKDLFTRVTLHHETTDETFDQTLGLGYTQYDRAITDPNATPVVPSTYHSERTKLDWLGNYRVLEGETVSLGAEAERELFNNSNPLSAHQTETAGFVQLQSAIGEHVFDTLSLRLDDYSTFGSKMTWRVAPVVIVPVTRTKLKFTYGTAFKVPTLDELYDSYPAWGFYANPNLKPETSTGIDAGFEQPVPGTDIRVSATYFYNDIKNLIDYNDTFTSEINVGRATTQGVEGIVTWEPSKRLTASANYTFTQARNDILHQALLRRPKNKASLEANWRVTDTLTLSTAILYTGSWIDVARSGYPSGIVTGDYVTANVAMSYDLGHGLEAYGRVTNLTDRRYQDPLGYLNPGIGVFAGLRAKFDAKQLGLAR